MKQRPERQWNHAVQLRSASVEEAGLFYSQVEEDRGWQSGTVGHVRMDFGHGGKEFWHTWWPHNQDQFNTPKFKETLQTVVDALRRDGPLKDLSARRSYCQQHGGAITEDGENFGYIAEMEHLSAILSRWFDKHRGTALGLAAAGSGAAAVIMPSVLAGIIESKGLSQAFLWEAALGGVMTVLVILFVKNSPSEYKISHHSNDKRSISFHADKNSVFILAAAFLLGAPAGPGFSHLTVLYQQAGLSPAYTSWLISYLGLMLIVGEILYGYLSDRLGGYRANMLAFFAITLVNWLYVA